MLLENYQNKKKYITKLNAESPKACIFTLTKIKKKQFIYRRVHKILKQTFIISFLPLVYVYGPFINISSII